MRFLVHPDDSLRFESVTGLGETRRYEAILSSGGTAIVVDYGEVDSNNIVTIEGDGFEGYGYARVNGVDLEIQWGDVTYTVPRNFKV